MPDAQQIILLARPNGVPRTADFELREAPLPDLADGQVLVRTEFISVDPYIRGRISGRKSYIAPIPVGGVVEGGSVGHVVASKYAGLKEGDVVGGMWGWQSAAVMNGKHVEKLDTSLAPISAFLGVLGMPGMTAYFGLLDVCEPTSGEMVFVSGAAGAVGSLVGQIAKLHGCRAAGSTGSDDKVAHLIDECHFDAAFNYHTKTDYAKALQECCPDGIDVYFDNTGGPLTDAAIMHMNEHGRIAICGQIDQYNSVDIPQGPRVLFQFIIKRLRAEGFLVSDFARRFAEAREQIAQWLSDGKIVYHETISDGIANTPEAFIGLFSGANTGKQLVRVLPRD